MDNNQIGDAPFKNAACIACQKRKGKCIGNPCAYCLKKNLICEFASAKKRGPKRLKLTLQNSIESENSMVNTLQESMNQFCQQIQFIDFYFQYIGKTIPIEYKESLMTGKLPNSEYKTQLYIIAASMMKMYGNRDLENQYINKAHKSSDLFNSDTLDSAITLMMMTTYLGSENPKARKFILVAQNTLQLTDHSVPNIKAQLACQVMSVSLDSSIPIQQKRAFIYSFISGDFDGNLGYATETDKVRIAGSRVKLLIQEKAGFSDHTIPEFLNSISSTYLMNPEDYSFILEEIEKMERLVETLKDSNILTWKHGTQMVRSSRFLLEWRSGNITAAHYRATQLMNSFKDHLQVIATWLQDGYASILAVPYFFKKCGQEDLMKEFLKCIQEPFVGIRRGDEVQNIWEEMCGKKPGYNITQLEADLLGSLQTTTKPMYITYHPSPSPINNHPQITSSPILMPANFSPSNSANNIPQTPNNTPNFSPNNSYNPLSDTAEIPLTTNNFPSDNISNNFIFADNSYYDHPLPQDLTFNTFV